MKLTFNNKEIYFIKFCDYIEVITDNNTYIFNIVWTKENDLCLQYEDELLIRELKLSKDKLTINYINGEIKELEEEIKKININDQRFRRKYPFNIEGSLLKYTEDMAIKYNLDKELSYATLCHIHIKKRTK